jgi:hypothetical protein
MRSRTHHLRLAALALLALVAVSACSSGSAEEEAASPAEVVAVKGTQSRQVKLTEDAVRRVGLKVEAVTAGPTGSQVPYGAVVYDAKGAAWAFVNTAPRTYLRQSITLDHIDGGIAYLTAGPSVGAKVVTVGAAELYGAEAGVGDDE